MQLKQNTTPLSLIVTSLLLTNSIYAEDYVRINYMQYDENDNRVSVKAPSLAINKELGVDYTLNASVVNDTVTGASPIYVDSTSGASAFNSRGVNKTPIKKNVSFDENRISGSVSLISRLQNRDEITSSFSKSYEHDYDANTIGIDYLHWANKSKNRSYNIGISYAFNNIVIGGYETNTQYEASGEQDDGMDNDSKVVHLQSFDTRSGASQTISIPSSSADENKTVDTTSGASKTVTSTILSSEMGVSQIIDKSSLMKGSIFYSKEEGYLSNPYYNVIRNGNEIVAEKRPDKRVAYGFNLKYIRAFTSKLSTKFKYKFYTDDWDIISHTVDINNYYELNDTYIIGFGIRSYTQSEANFYSKDINHFTNEVYASADDRLSSFTSKTYKTSLDYKYDDQISYNISFDRYNQSTGLKTRYLTLGLKYKF